MITPTVLATLLALCSASGSIATIGTPTLLSRSITVALASPLAESPAQQMRALETWTQDFERWQYWFARWKNQSEPGGLATHGRRPKPEPPSWLPTACASLVEDSGPLADGCRAYDAWRRDDIVASGRRR